ncbi:DUF4129 domain-containing protein [Streptomyces sp. BI20]|uniref:DUF4129 domain-containing protein n=1 Tax=Streptomyces sp. BI20 TaxID=3403460 RepID=UPI003C728655
MIGPGGTTAPPLDTRTTADAVLAAAPPPTPVTGEAGREAARRELLDPIYHQDDPSLLERAWRKLGEWLDELFSGAASVTPGGTVGVIVALALLVLAVALLWWRLGRPHAPGTHRPGEVFDDTTRTAADHRADADAHATAGRWNEAVQERMRGLVRALEERVLLAPRPGRTADEAAAEAAVPLPGHAAELRAAARLFDEVTYGGRTADRAAHDRLHTLDTALTRTTPTHPQTTPTPGGHP